MLPGKKYKPEDFVRIAWARRWFIIIPTVVIVTGTIIVSSLLPNRYSSSTLILVVPQRIPESYVRSTVTSGVAERLQTISQQILSRTRLERIIEEFNLYQRERETMIMEDVVQLMRTRDIKLEVSGGRRADNASSFSVAFETTDPRTAMQVADRLASMFVQENLQEREVQADSTNQFLQAQLEDARRRLIEHEQKLVQFRLRNSGQLPTQMQSNLQMMQMTQAQIQANVDASVRERDRLAVVEAAISEAVETVDRPLPAAAESGTDNQASTTAAQQLEAARAALRGLQMRRLKPDHPDVVRAQRAVSELEVRVADETARAPEGGPASVTSPVTPERPKLSDKVAALRVEAEQLRKSLEQRAAEDERLKQALGSYSARLEATPKLESELTELMRDYDTIQEQYRTLLRKSEDAKIAVNLERRQIGEHFKVIDGARLPERPVSPNRTRINLLGLLGGLALGIGLVALLEYRDTTLKTDEDIVTTLALPVVAVIPVMLTGAERARRRRLRLAVGVAASAVAVVAAAAVISWRLQLLPFWVR